MIKTGYSDRWTRKNICHKVSEKAAEIGLTGEDIEIQNEAFNGIKIIEKTDRNKDLIEILRKFTLETERKNEKNENNLQISGDNDPLSSYGNFHTFLFPNQKNT